MYYTSYYIIDIYCKNIYMPIDIQHNRHSEEWGKRTEDKEIFGIFLSNPNLKKTYGTNFLKKLTRFTPL